MKERLISMQYFEGTIASFGEGEHHGSCTFSFHEKKKSISNKKSFISPLSRCLETTTHS